jgi:hypothetical protein
LAGAPLRGRYLLFWMAFEVPLVLVNPLSESLGCPGVLALLFGGVDPYRHRFYSMAANAPGQSAGEDSSSPMITIERENNKATIVSSGPPGCSASGPSFTFGMLGQRPGARTSASTQPQAVDAWLAADAL